ncbi:MAG: threonine/serine dehydratase [Thermoleophilia bacterium]|nr:threonine/serine dehydratase [Thermoleophilia bacterium]MDH5333423.1 threonine/serine dehydratase [Thermoleophilia bacterium]
MPDLAVTPDDVARAAEIVRGRLHRTPIFSARSLREGLSLKAELFQRTGSFKPRGVLTSLAALGPEERSRGVISVSAGNHAQALAWGAGEEGIDALLVMWRGASAAKVAATRAYGAEVDLHAADPAEAFGRLHDLVEATGRVFVHPFDAPATIAGQGTVGLEVLQDVPGVDTVVVPCGGGGLVSGVAVACVPAGVRVVAVEPAGSTALRSGLAAGAPVPVRPDSIADALSAPFAGEHAVRICAALGVEVVTVSDDEIREAFRTLYARAKLAVEPGAAASLAAVLAGGIDGERIVAVVSGGNVSAEIASGILAGR